MVSLRCKMAVKEELDKIKLKHTSIELGEVNLKKNIFNINDMNMKMYLTSKLSDMKINVVSDLDKTLKFHRTPYFNKRMHPAHLPSHQKD